MQASLSAVRSAAECGRSRTPVAARTMLFNLYGVLGTGRVAQPARCDPVWSVKHPHGPVTVTLDWSAMDRVDAASCSRHFHKLERTHNLRHPQQVVSELVSSPRQVRYRLSTVGRGVCLAALASASVFLFYRTRRSQGVLLRPSHATARSGCGVQPIRAACPST